MKYRRVLTKTGEAIPDVLYIEVPRGLLVWHLVDGTLWMKRRLATLTTADVAQSGHADELILSPVMEDPRELSELTDEDLLALARGDAELPRAA
jgi:hypothetical protein